MTRYLLRRLLLLVPTLIGVTIITFLMLHYAGGDPAELKLGFHATPENLQRMRGELGLLDPLPVQYGRFLLGALHGDFGRSYVTNAQVSTEIFARFPATIELALAAMAIAIAAGFVVGIVSAVRYHTAADSAATAAVLVGVSVPVFWLGMILIIVFAVTLGWLPVSGMSNPRVEPPPTITHFLILDSAISGNWDAFKDAIAHIVMPAVALAGWPAAILARQTRSSLLEVLGKDYVRTARAKGLGERVVVLGHALRNALLPVVTVTGLEFGRLLGGAVVTETVFAWPGVGHMVVDAISARDYVLVQGAVLLFAVVFAFLNLLADVVYAFLDPRIRYT